MLETINFLRKKFKMWPQTLKYHSLEAEETAEEQEISEQVVPIISCLTPQAGELPDELI